MSLVPTLRLTSLVSRTSAALPLRKMEAAQRTLLLLAPVAPLAVPVPLAAATTQAALVAQAPLVAQATLAVALWACSTVFQGGVLF